MASIDAIGGTRQPRHLTLIDGALAAHLDEREIVWGSPAAEAARETIRYHNAGDPDHAIQVRPGYFLAASEIIVALDLQLFIHPGLVDQFDTLPPRHAGS